MTTLLAAVIVLGVLILVHELGHFWAAKWVDIEVPRFSIGLGPKAFGFQKGETEYVVSWLPLGGYVKMAGMGEEEALAGLEGESEADREPSERDFDAKPLWARFVVISAGVFMNFLFAAGAFAVIAGVWGVPESQESIVGEVLEESLPPEALQLARTPRGARVVSVGDESVSTMQDLRYALLMGKPGPVQLRFADAPPLTFRLPEDDSLKRAVAASVVPPWKLEPVIGAVQEGGPAAAAGLRPGDRVVNLAGEPVEGWQGLRAAVEQHPGEEIVVTVRRDTALVELRLVPDTRILAFGGDTLRYGRIAAARDTSAPGMALEQLDRRRRAGPVAAAAHGVSETWRWTALIFEFVAQLIQGDVGGEALAGPVRIVQYSGEVARRGVASLLNFMAILSVNLAILNLLPIPVLDGGHLLFLGIEAVRGRPVTAETRMRWAQLGMLVVLALMVWLIGNDLLQIFGG